MNLKQYFGGDDRGVSPVIGVILMVAITVILAAVIATFVMNMGPSESTPANANWDFSNETSHFLLEHNGGGDAPASEYSLQVEFDTGSEEVPLTSSNGYGSDAELSASDSFKLYNASGTWAGSGSFTGQYWEMPSAGSVDNSTATTVEVELIWNDPEGGQSQIIDNWEP